jgi:hypothetical protein
LTIEKLNQRLKLEVTNGKNLTVRPKGNTVLPIPFNLWQQAIVSPKDKKIATVAYFNHKTRKPCIKLKKLKIDIKVIKFIVKFI